MGYRVIFEYWINHSGLQVCDSAMTVWCWCISEFDQERMAVCRFRAGSGNPVRLADIEGPVLAACAA